MHSALTLPQSSPLVHFNQLTPQFSEISHENVTDAIALIKYMESTGRLNVDRIVKSHSADCPWLDEINELLDADEVTDGFECTVFDRVLLRMLMAGILIGRGAR